MEPTLGAKGAPDRRAFYWFAGGKFLPLVEILECARRLETPVKFFDDEGRLVGTAYPDGEVES